MSAALSTIAVPHMYRGPYIKYNIAPRMRPKLWESTFDNKNTYSIGILFASITALLALSSAQSWGAYAPVHSMVGNSTAYISRTA